MESRDGTQLTKLWRSSVVKVEVDNSVIKLKLFPWRAGTPAKHRFRLIFICKYTLWDFRGHSGLYYSKVRRLLQLASAGMHAGMRRGEKHHGNNQAIHLGSQHPSPWTQLSCPCGWGSYKFSINFRSIWSAQIMQDCVPKQECSWLQFLYHFCPPGASITFLVPLCEWHHRCATAVLHFAGKLLECKYKKLQECTLGTNNTATTKFTIILYKSSSFNLLKMN